MKIKNELHSITHEIVYNKFVFKNKIKFQEVHRGIGSLHSSHGRESSMYFIGYGIVLKSRVLGSLQMSLSLCSL